MGNIVRRSSPTLDTCNEQRRGRQRNGRLGKDGGPFRGHHEPGPGPEEFSSETTRARRPIVRAPRVFAKIAATVVRVAPNVHAYELQNLPSHRRHEHRRRTGRHSASASPAPRPELRVTDRGGERQTDCQGTDGGDDDDEEASDTGRPRTTHRAHDVLYHAERHPHKYRLAGEELYQEGFIGQFDERSQDSSTSSEDLNWWENSNVIPVANFELPQMDNFFLWPVEDFRDGQPSGEDPADETGGARADRPSLCINPVVIRFFSHECQGSAAIEPYYAGLSCAYPKVIFLEADVSFNRDLTASCRVVFTPTFVIFKEGKEVGRLTGVDVNDLTDFITAYAPRLI